MDELQDDVLKFLYDKGSYDYHNTDSRGISYTDFVKSVINGHSDEALNISLELLKDQGWIDVISSSQTGENHYIS